MITPDEHTLAMATMDIAQRLADPVTVASQTRPRTAPQSLANGAAGIALLHIERARAGRGDWSTVHAWLATAAGGDLSAGPNAGLFFGAPALGFVLQAAADRPGRYTQALADLDAATTALTRARLDQAHARIDRAERPTLAEWDIFRGLTGLGAYHLHHHRHHDVITEVLAYLVRLTEPSPDGLPGWWTDCGPDGQVTADYPGGHGNFGMAHGIAGPLALLALTMRAGVVVDGHIEAINRICAWLDTWRQDHPAGPWWPRTITQDEVHSGCPRDTGPLQPSWCYGTPGLARAQQLAGIATGDTERRQMAEAALLGCLNDPTQLARITTIGLCHGTAGLLQTTFRAAADASTSDITVHLPHLCTRLLTQLCCTPQDAELLSGTTGAALALHAAADRTAPLCGWDRCLLLD